MLLAECISVTVQNNKVCIDLPFGFKQHCLSVPSSIPNGQKAQACLHICTHFGLPTGIKVEIRVGNNTVYQQTIGSC